MRKKIFGGAGLVIVLFALTIISWKPVSREIEPNMSTLYEEAGLAAHGLSSSVFEQAIEGFNNLKNSGKLSETKSVLSIADFDMNSTRKRLWIIDLDKRKLILNTWVAHGERSGADKPVYFSNSSESFKSSIGFYITGERYQGKHGLSLKLDGVDQGFNTNARKRAIVIHGASYVSQETISALGRLGRSQGCPAVPQELAATVVKSIEDRTVLFIHVSDPDYTSVYLNQNPASILASK